MLRSRPVQYLGLALLVLVSLAIIFYPFGPRPQEQEYALTLTAPKPFQQLVGSTKKVGDEANKALLKEFSTGERLPGDLTVVEGTGANAGTKATITDRAATRAQATTRANRIVAALGKTFKGVTLDPASQAKIDELPPAPLATVGQYAVFPIRQRDGNTFPAIKLGLDLQGGVNLVLQVRRALFTYNFDKKLGNDPDARDQFATQVRDALAKSSQVAGLNQVDVNLVPDQNVLEVRTQAKDRAEFDAQRQAIQNALKTALPDAKFTEAHDPQFFDPEAAMGERGAHLVNAGGSYSGELMQRTVEIVRSRVDKLGVSEPLIQQQGTNRIIVQLPGVNDPQKAVDVIGKTAQMEIRLLPQGWHAMADHTGQNTTFTDDKGNPVPAAVARQKSELIISGADVKPTSTVGSTEKGPAVFFELQGSGAAKFGEATTKYVGRIMPIFLDERCISAPNIESPITGGSGQISGGFKDMEEARGLALLLNSGALPAPIDVVENRTVSATLGTDSLIKSVRAGLVGIAAVAVFMLAFYRLPGLLANFALVIYCILNLAFFILLGGTLTLPGIAGFLLAIAMSLDTNILVFERLREEMAIQPTFAAALRAAFSRAWTAILDSHVTTLIAALVLFYLGTGPVKGFALTLGIGVLLSLFSAISVTRLFMWSAAGLGERNKGLFARPVARATALATQSR
ncbi:MAG: protein translocase subunit SecD [Abitibacteriaceae bacterium]|nr:protein translocase subunit SecD [Abditibacteriaceae bacterium]